jgi:hypothetical protein
MYMYICKIETTHADITPLKVLNYKIYFKHHYYNGKIVANNYKKDNATVHNSI